MKILISSHVFAPSIGGIETVSGLLAGEFVRMGHAVTVLTQTAEKSKPEFPFQVIRRPSLGELLRASKWCDVYWHSNLSLRTFWPALLLGTPVVITHHGSYCRQPSGIDFVQRLKHVAIQRATSVAISAAVAACFEVRSEIVHNPFDARLFNPGIARADRPNNLIFVGRFVKEKGLDILLLALEQLRHREVCPGLTVVGAGPELNALEDLAARLGLREQVNFLGVKRGEELAARLREHKILVVPSRDDEPFGVVALEGIACGCVVLGSSGGGLPEAIGPCGLTFPNGDAAALAALIERLWREPRECARFTAQASQHLAHFQPARIAAAYLALFQAKLR